MNIAGHPGIQDRLNSEPFGGTHQKGRAGEERRGGEDFRGGGDNGACSHDEVVPKFRQGVSSHEITIVKWLHPDWYIDQNGTYGETLCPCETFLWVTDISSHYLHAVKVVLRTTKGATEVAPFVVQ